jgi:hypothetical protein
VKCGTERRGYMELVGVLTGVGDEGERLDSATDRGGGQLGRRTGSDAPGAGR